MASLPLLIEEDVREFNRALQDLVVKSDSSAALIIDKGGFLITDCGESRSFDLTTLAALSAALFAATQGIAGLVSETNFSCVYQQGDTYSLLVLNVDEFCLLTIIFKAEVSVGAVKYYATSTVKAISKQLKRAQKRDPDGGLDLSEMNVADTGPIFRRKAV